MDCNTPAGNGVLAQNAPDEHSGISVQWDPKAASRAHCRLPTRGADVAKTSNAAMFLTDS